MIAAEPALGVSAVGRRVRRRAGGDRRLRRPEVAVHARPRPRRRRPRRRRRARSSGWRPTRPATLRRAGLVHGLGRLGVSNSIWDKPGPLGAGEWERVRLQPYLTERMLHQSPSLAPLGAIAVQHRERLDGSGYPRGLSGAAISPPARILGAADAYQSMREPRPHRRRARRRGGRGRAARPRSRPAGSTATRSTPCSPPPATASRAAGRARPGSPPARSTCSGWSPAACRARRSPRELVISPKTARNHIEHIYTKIGASSRVDRQPVRHAARPAPRGVPDHRLTPRRWGNCPMRPPGCRRYLPSAIDGRRIEAAMSLRSRFFALTYDRQMAKAEKAGLRALRQSLLAGGQRRRARDRRRDRAEPALYGPRRVAHADRARAADAAAARAPAPASRRRRPRSSARRPRTSRSTTTRSTSSCRRWCSAG